MLFGPDGVKFYGGNLKIITVVAKWIFVLCLPVLLLSASIGWAANSLWLYSYGSEKYEVSQRLADAGLELTDTKLENIYSGLINYFNSGEEYIDLTVVKQGKPVKLFTPEEVIHFKDVKGLIWLDYWLLLGTLIYTGAYAGISLFWRKRKYWRHLAWVLVGGSSLTLALMLALALGTVFGLGQLFLQFHFLFFSNEYWYAEGYMLLLFPEPFFYETTLFCALATVTGAVVLGGAGGWHLLLTRRRATSR